MNKVHVGDEVGYGCYGSWGRGLLSSGFARVTKINRWGHITLDNGKVFDNTGRERNARFGELHLMAADDLRERLQAEQADRARNQAAAELRNLLDGQRNGFGDTCQVSDQVRARMIELVNSL